MTQKKQRRLRQNKEREIKKTKRIKKQKRKVKENINIKTEYKKVEKVAKWRWHKINEFK